MKSFFRIITFQVLFFIMFTNITSGQHIIDAKVIDANSSQELEYVNIGVLEKTNGTVSDTNGNFILEIDDKNALVKFSSIGYLSRTISVEKLLDMAQVTMEATSYDLQKIQVNASKFGKEIKKGKEIKRKNTVWGWTKSEHLGVEIGMRIKIKKETFIKSAHFGMHKNSADSILFRINIYDFKNGVVGKNLMPNNVYVLSNDISTYAPVDLSDLNIVVNDDIILTLETIQKTNYNEKDFVYFSIKEGLRRSNVFYREASQANFKTNKELNMGLIKHKIGFYLMVKESDK